MQENDTEGSEVNGTGESLLDTFPGRIFIEHLLSVHYSEGLSPRAVIDAMCPEDLIRAATYAVSRYLYSGDCLRVMRFDVTAADFQEFDTAGMAALLKLSTFKSPQIHQGSINAIVEPNIRNRDPLSALPDGAFWTSSPITQDEDSWTLSGENLKRVSSRWKVSFDATRVRLVHIDSARDWNALIESNSVKATGVDCKFPDWPNIAKSWDAVHVSPAGLLLAHPPIAMADFSETDGSGYTHSQTGTYTSVATWSAVSTAWLHEPPNVKLRLVGDAMNVDEKPSHY